MTFTTPKVDHAYREHAQLLLRHHSLLSRGETGEEMDGVEEKMSALWESLDEDQRQSLRGASSDLNWILRRGALPPNGRPGAGVTEADLVDLEAARVAGEWHEVLRRLRVCASAITIPTLAAYRAEAYGGVGLPAYETTFRDFAEAMAPGGQGGGAAVPAPEGSPSAPSFFDEQSEQSHVKAAIVSKYFWAWGKIITSYLKGSGQDMSIQYIDLFAGPGRYKSGAKSTPVLIIEQAIGDPLFRGNLTTIFNDKDDANTSTLLTEIAAIKGIETLSRQPRVYTNEVGSDIVKMFGQLSLVPTLMFVDPWGYKGLSLKLIDSVLKDWACECIFFFNYNRINMGLSNPVVKTHMESLFGEERARQLTGRLEGMPPSRREMTVVEEICQALKSMGGRYVLPFAFKNEKGNRTSHHLIFVSKHPLGYEMMKEIMAKESSSAPQGVASFEYNPADKDQPLLYGLGSPEELGQSLLRRFAGRTLTVQQLFEEHNVDTPYVKKNYKEVITQLEQEGRITADPPHTARPKRKGEVTCADSVRVRFPPPAP